jgi:hypothetical protein
LEYLITGSLVSHKQGANIKTVTIITDEPAKAGIKKKLRGMKDEDMTPKNFAKVLNEELLKEIPNAPAMVSLRTAT